MCSDYIIYGSWENSFLFWKWFNSTSDEGMIITNTFEVTTTSRDSMKLSPGAKRILDTPNAGGSSAWSEAISFECLHSMFKAELLLTETEIEYDALSSIMDFSVTIANKSIGVSVTRILNFRDLSRKYKGIFSFQGVRDILTKKLFGATVATSGVMDHQKWQKQCLHIFTTSQLVTDAVKEEYNAMDSCFKKNNYVIVTHFKNAEWIF